MISPSGVKQKSKLSQDQNLMAEWDLMKYK